MQTRQLGTSDLHITPLGVGAWAMGGAGWAFSWGAQDDDASIGAIHAALDKGINWIDTAPVYGLGHSEEVVGRAIKGLSNRPYVFTKCERRWSDDRVIYKSLKRESILSECEDSLRRLASIPLTSIRSTGLSPTKISKKAGKPARPCRRPAKSAGSASATTARSRWRASSRSPPSFRCNLPTASFHPKSNPRFFRMLARTTSALSPIHPWKSGLLSGAMSRERVVAMPEDDFRRRTPNYQEPLLTRNLDLAELLRSIGAHHGRTTGEVAIAWTLRTPGSHRRYRWHAFPPLRWME